MDETFEIIKAGAPDAPPEQALYRIQQTYPDGSGGRLNVDWDGLRRLHGLIHDRIALEGCHGEVGNNCWYYRAQYAGMTKVCMRKSIVECGQIKRFGLCPIPLINGEKA